MKKRKKCKKFKMPTSFTTIIILTIAVAVLTFIIPAGQYEYKEGMPVAGTYQVVTSNPQGLWDILKAPIEGFRGAIDIILFVFGFWAAVLVFYLRQRLLMQLFLRWL